MKRDNHYVAQSHLKKWADSENKVWKYRLIVSDTRVPYWNCYSPKSIAYRRDLYTRVRSGIENDDIERWFDHEFENPAQRPIDIAISGGQLTQDDWYYLIRYVALQDVRTPTRLIKHIRLAQQVFPDLINQVLEETKEKLVTGKFGSKNLQRGSDTSENGFPLKVIKEPSADSGFSRIKAETIPGRATWLHVIQHQLKNTAKILHQHRWTILHPCDGLVWPVSDNPVIKLNYYKDGSYDFKGGWDSKNTEIILPLSPEHILYTKIGERPPLRGTRLDHRTSELIRKFIIESAHRTIFSNKPDRNVLKIRPRLVNAQIFNDEHNQWLEWHNQQSSAERELL